MEKLSYISRKIPKIGYLLGKKTLKIGRGFEGRVTPPCKPNLGSPLECPSKIANDTWKQLGQKKKIIALPSIKILNIWVCRSKNNVFLINFFKAPKTTKFGCIFHPFLKKGKKKHPIWQKLGAFPTLFLTFYFWRWIDPWGQYNIVTFSWPKKNTSVFSYKTIGYD